MEIWTARKLGFLYTYVCRLRRAVCVSVTILKMTDSLTVHAAGLGRQPGEALVSRAHQSYRPCASQRWTRNVEVRCATGLRGSGRFPTAKANAVQTLPNPTGAAKLDCKSPKSREHYLSDG